MLRNKLSKGFTLIELLVVISIIAVLATVVFVALNPAKRLKDTRDSRRWSDVNNIMTAIHECIVDNAGSLSTCGLSSPLTTRQLGTAATGCNNAGPLCGTNTACLNLSSNLAAYLKSVPIDPILQSTSSTSYYSVAVDSNGIVTVSSCGGNLESTSGSASYIQLSR